MLKNGLSQKSFSQNGEDILIDKLLGEKRTGFYVDVGAYHPSRLNNTKRFYLRGWTGINIEPDPKKIENFYNARPKDINLNFGVANKTGKLLYYRFEPETLSTFSQTAAEDFKKQGFRLIGTFKVKVFKLADILEKYSKNQQIDFVSIDVEGYDYEVLESNNWKKFRPKLVCIEAEASDDKKFEIFMAKLGYKKVCKNHNNLIFSYD